MNDQPDDLDSLRAKVSEMDEALRRLISVVDVLVKTIREINARITTPIEP